MVRGGVALLLTLLFIAGAMGIAVYYVDIRQKIIETLFAYRSIAQTSLLLQDLQKVLGGYARIKDEELDMLLTGTAALGSEDGKFTTSFVVSNPQSRVNINLLAKKRTKKYVAMMLYNIGSRYDVYDPQLFADIILDAIDLDLRERTAGGEIALDDRNFRNGPIVSWERFEKIVARYFQLTHDESIFRVPWREIFAFDDHDLIIDCARLSPLAKEMLGFKENEDLCAPPQDHEKAALKEALKIQKYAPKKPYILNVTARYWLDTFHDEVVVGYDIGRGEVKYVEQ
jgi:hypothetical protein